jgi:hypothetical protein
MKSLAESAKFRFFRPMVGILQRLAVSNRLLVAPNGCTLLVG